MATIAGMKDSRDHGPPADIGTFQFPATVMVFKHTHSGVTYNVVKIAGANGWVLEAQNPEGAIEVELQTAIDALPAVGGKVVLLEGDYVKSNVAAITIPSNVEIELLAGATIQLLEFAGDGATIFANADEGDGNEYILITGGTLHGGQNQWEMPADEHIAIKFTKVSHSKVDCHMTNFFGRNVWEVTPGAGNVVINREYLNSKEIDVIHRNMRSRIQAYSGLIHLDDFETADWSEAADHFFDSAEFYRGTRSMKFEVPAGGNVATQRNFAPHLDLERAAISLQVFNDNPTGTSQITIAFKDGAGNWSAYYVGEAQIASLANTWVTLSQGEDSVNYAGGNPADMADIETIKINPFALPGEVLNVWVDDLCYFYPTAGGGLVSINFDDGLDDTYTTAKLLMDKYGFPGTAFVITRLVDEAGRMTLEQLKEMQDCGWDISSHSTTDEVVPNKSNAGIEDKLRGAQDWLISHGFVKGSRFYAAPATNHNEEVAEIGEKYYALQRGASNASIPLPVFEPRCMGAWFYHSADGLPDAYAVIDQAVDRGLWLAIAFHEVAVAGDTTTADFEAIIDYLHETGIRVLTFSDVLDNHLFRYPTRVQCSDLFMDVLAVSANNIVTAQALELADPTVCVIAAQPDVPRTLSWVFTHPTLTAFTLDIVGVNAKGRTVTETYTEADGWTGETNNAFSTVTSITVQDMDNEALGDTLDVGITDVLGLSNPVNAGVDVYKIKKNNADEDVAVAEVSALYDTYDMAVIGLGAADDFTIWYKSNLNVLGQ